LHSFWRIPETAMIIGKTGDALTAEIAPRLIEEFTVIVKTLKEHLKVAKNC